MTEQQSQRQSAHVHEPLSQQPQHGQDPQLAFDRSPIPTGMADVRASAEINSKDFMTESSWGNVWTECP